MSYIMPVGVGISGSETSFGGASYGMGVYRKNAADQPSSGSSVNGAAKPYEKEAGPYSNGKISEEADIKRRFDSFECQTCKNRRYQDGSDDSGVSFQTPTKIAPQAAAAAVRSHEQEHVSRNQSKADREGKKIVSQTVTIHTAICPECGRIYVSGGTTKTTTRNAPEADKFKVGLSDPFMDSGKKLNSVA